MTSSDPSQVDPVVETSGLVSVIIPFFDDERFLAEAIDSVLAQTVREWEIILVDDGSPDGSTEIATAYSRRDSERIRCVSHENRENRGLPATRNLGIAHARGEFVALLDADDVWLPNKLERRLRIARNHPELGMICGASQYWVSWSDPDRPDKIVPVGGPQDRVIDSGRLIKEIYPLKRGGAPCPCSLFLRRSAIQRVGGFEESFTGIFQMYEDQAFLSKMYLNEKIFIASECLDRYRRHPDSMMRKIRRAGRYDEVRRFYLEWLEGYLKTHGIRDRETRRLLRRALLPYRHPIAFRWVHDEPKAILKKARSVWRKLVAPAKKAWKRLA